MADVVIDSSVSLSTARDMRSVVFVSALVGYFFYTDSDQTWGYSKTTDGGATWGAIVPLEASPTGRGGDVWFDQWTPGDSGTKIHTCWVDATLHGVRYRSLDTADDSLSSTTTIFAGVSYASSRGVFCSIGKSRSGYLYCAYDIDAGAEKGLARSTDSGATWGVLDTGFVEATIDQCMLYPATGTGDNNDIWALYHDASADALTLKMWDSSAGSAVESATIMTLVENTTDGTGQYGFSASVRHSDGHLIVAGVSERDTATSDHLTFDIAGTGSITALAAITTDIDDHYYPAVFIDQLTGHIYVAYAGKRDGSETFGGGTPRIYYTKSTDAGTSWSAGDTTYSESPYDPLNVWVPLMGPRFFVGWRAAGALRANAVYSIAFGGAGSSGSRPVVFSCT